MRITMKKNKIIAAMAITMSLTMISCSDDKTDNNQQTSSTTSAVSSHVQSPSGIMSYIPADTPILMVYAKDPKNPLPQNLKDKMENIYSNFGDFVKMTIEENFKKLDKDDPKSKEVSEFIDKWLSEESITKLGFAIDENEFALYTVDLFPVLRMTLAKTHAMDEVLDELMNKANEKKPGTSVKKDVNGVAVYQFGDKEMQVMIALNGNSIVASLAPTREVDALMPTLLGFEKPSKNIQQSAQFHDTISKYNYMSNSLYWINIRQIADVFVNPDQHKSPMLDMMKLEDKILSADCKTEILQIFDKFPRIVGGTTELSNHSMNSHMVIELMQGLGTKLAAIQGRIPNYIGDSAISYGFSFNIANAKDLAMEFVSNIETSPYKCELLSGMNEKATAIKAKLGTPLPPFVSNFKGINIIVDELELDMSKKEPNEMIKSLKAKVLVAVDNPEALQGMAAMMMPDIQKLGIKVDGGAVNVSSLIPVKGTMMPVNLDHVFMAMGNETIGLSLGEGTDVTLTESVAADSESHFLSFKITAEIYKSIFASLNELTNKLPKEVRNQIKMQQLMMTDMLWWQSETVYLDFTDRGFEIKADISY